ncbi:hypothetical protein DSO57_1005894 [Entomophthora muscae]|uniref:Uncharacterized protein n=1 Tax=Entomophthora muscae TaxID=34485 RepID=A0ACC2S9M2_9FUNG|nr:hypothetical protein DSO57_1005894 [Entomophthora muscae]
MKLAGSLFVSGILVSVLGSDNFSSYRGHVVIDLDKTPEVAKLVDEFDVWTCNRTSYQVRVNQQQLEMIQRANARYTTLVGDVQKLLVENTPALRATGDWFTAYHKYEEIVKWYSEMAKKNPTAVKFVPSIGKTVEGRDTPAVHITNPNGSIKKKIWFESLIHAREWITGSTLQYVLNHLVENRESDPKIKALLDQVEIVAVPIVNPDGYSYTWSNKRLWRKNRHVVSGGVGIDLNRNFPFRWGEANGASTRPSSETYQGPSPASEPETKNIIAYFQKQGAIAGAIDFHSYSQLVLRPYGTSEADAPDEAHLVKLGDDIVKKIQEVSGKRYINEKIIDLYPASGGASDFFYGAGHKTYGYTIELSPASNAYNGFVLPPSNIIPVGKDLVPAVLHFITYVLENPLDA